MAPTKSEHPKPPKGKVVQQVPADAAEYLDRPDPQYESGPLFPAEDKSK